MATKKKKKSALAEAASRRLVTIGMPKMTPQDVAHAMYHAEERGDVERVPTEDGWGWLLPAQGGKERQVLKPTPEMLAHLDELAQGRGHNH